MNKTASREQVAKVLESFLDGSGGKWAWDDYTLGTSFEDHGLEEIRLRSAGLSKEFPPTNPSEYCNQEGREVIRNYIKQLRSPAGSVKKVT
jgi:hypothetical protein